MDLAGTRRNAADACRCKICPRCIPRKQAIKDQNRRFYVELGSAEAAQGTWETLNIGVRGIRDENEILGQLATRIARDFFKINGIDPQTGKPIE